jgi:hypothetical protein
MGGVGATGAMSATGAQGATGAVVGGGQGVRGATGPARAALATHVASITVRRASIVLVPGAPSSPAATYSLPAGFAVTPEDAFKAVYTDGELVPRGAAGWSPSVASTMTLTLAPGVYGVTGATYVTYGVWAVGVSSDTPTLSWTLRATTSEAGEIVVHKGVGESVPGASYREYVLDACAWSVERLMFDVPACANVRVYFRLVPVARALTTALDAMVTGHAFRLYIKFVPSAGETRVLGLMQYTRFGRLFTKNPPSMDPHGHEPLGVEMPSGA